MKFMGEKFKSERVFIKDSGDLDMLRQSLGSQEIDKGMIPVLEKFLSLPITPRESCYGQAEESKSPYLSYVEDDVQSERDKNFQRLFREKTTELAARINGRIGGEVVRITMEEADHGGGPKDYTMRFEIIDKKVFQENGDRILGVIWDEFSKYVDELK